MSRVLMVASEAAPYAKTGGLADVVGALPAALQALGYEVAVLIPRYTQVQSAPSHRVWVDLPVSVGGAHFVASLFAPDDVKPFLLPRFSAVPRPRWPLWRSLGRLSG